MNNVKTHKHFEDILFSHEVSEEMLHIQSSDHTSESIHHHHSHADKTKHPNGHHLLQIENLTIAFNMYDSNSLLSNNRILTKVIDGLNISVHTGEVIAIVGASGSGKTLLADAIMGLYEPNSIVQGAIYFDGKKQTSQSLKLLRGKEIAFVPQSVAAFDPLMKIGKQIGGSREQRMQLYKEYRLDENVEYMYPFELSGGMARRALLCSALIYNPKLIIADEPTPGLDLELATKAMDDFRTFADNGGSVLLITHDIQLALCTADRVAVFKDGTVIEETSVESFENPNNLKTEFARKLWHALPEHDFIAFDEKCNR